MLTALLVASSIISSVLAAPTVASVGFHDWYVDVDADKAVRQEKNLAQYATECQFKGIKNVEGGCDFLIPRVLFAKPNVDGQLTICPTGYALENNRCRWLEIKDPFSTFYLDGKWWFVDTEKDRQLRLDKKHGLRDATCPDTLGFAGKVGSDCQTFAPMFLKADNGCPKGYVAAADSLCEWDGTSRDMLTNSVSLAYTQADALFLSVLKTVNSKVQQMSTNTNTISSKMILSAVGLPN